jgi:F0F1-type ATP synthase membrane subunit b/b'
VFLDVRDAKLMAGEKRLAQLERKIAAIQASAEAQAKQEEQLMLGKTAEDVRRILENAERGIGAAVRHARSELRAFAANLAWRGQCAGSRWARAESAFVRGR